MFWIELIIVLAIIFLGVRIGGTFLAMAGGIGMFIMTIYTACNTFRSADYRYSDYDCSNLCGSHHAGLRRTGLSC